MTTARAALLREPETPLVVEDIELADLQPGEVLIKIKGVGICHTDIAGAEGTIPLPLPAVLGHEGSGVVEAIGEGVTNVEPGDHVVLSFGHCGECGQCESGHPAYCEVFAALNYFGERMDGTTTMHQGEEPVYGNFFSQSSFASYAIANATNTVKVDKDLPLEILGPLGCGLQTGSGSVINVLKTKPGESVAIFGMGAVGLSAVMAAKAVGAGIIIAIDINDERLEVAKELGATHTINSLKTKDLEWDVQEIAAPGVHGALDAVGFKEVIATCVKILRAPGIAATVGFQGLEYLVEIDQGHLLIGRTLTGVIEGDANPQEFIPHLIDLYKDGKFPFDKLIKTYSLDQINDAIADNTAGTTIKPVVVFD